MIWVDADACPVKSEIVFIGKRFDVGLSFVSHQPIKALQNRKGMDFILCESGPDAADDYIVDHSQRGDLVLTMDLLLARRLLEKSVRVMSFFGKWIDEAEVADGLGRKELMLFTESLGVEMVKRNKLKNKSSLFKGLLHNACVNLFPLRQV